MAKEVCDKLIDKRPWAKYTDADEIPSEEGIYVIGVKIKGQRAIVYLYLGRSKDLRKRVKEHKYGSQEIDQFVKLNFQWNDGKDLRVKWIYEPKHKDKETAYIKCVEKKLGYDLKYNKIGRGK